jgi:hypothetical protein
VCLYTAKVKHRRLQLDCPRKVGNCTTRSAASIKTWHISNRKWQTHYPRNINKESLDDGSIKLNCRRFLFHFNYPTGHPSKGGPRSNCSTLTLEHSISFLSHGSPNSAQAKLLRRLLCQQQGVPAWLQSWPTWVCNGIPCYCWVSALKKIMSGSRFTLRRGLQRKQWLPLLWFGVVTDY